MLLTEAIDLTRQVRKGWKPTAKAFDTTVIHANHLIEQLNNPQIEEIGPMDIVKLQNTLLELGKAPATVNRITQALKTILNVCVKMRVLKDIPYYQPLDEPPGRDSIYTYQEEDDLYRAAKRLPNNSQLMHDILRFAFLTGARQGEIIKLQWGDVDFVRKRLTFLDTKSGKNRVLPLQGKLLELMTYLHRERVDDQIFHTHKDHLIYWWNKVREIAGITDRTKVFHTIRHTVCSRLWAKGAVQPDIMAVMGHTQATTTQRYSHATEEGIGNALALL